MVKKVTRINYVNANVKELGDGPFIGWEKIRKRYCKFIYLYILLL